MPRKKKRTVKQIKVNRQGYVSTKMITEKARKRKLKRGKAASYLSSDGKLLETSFQGYKSLKLKKGQVPWTDHSSRSGM